MYKFKVNKSSVKKNFSKEPLNKTKKKVAKNQAKVNAIGSMIEYHYYDNQPSRTLSLIGNVDNLLQVAEGDTSLTRTGLKITPTSAEFKIRTKAGPISADGALVRYMMVRDTQQETDTVPGTGDILETYGLRVLSPLSRLFRDRFEVIWDKVVTVSAEGAQGDTHYFSKKVRLPPSKPVYFNGATGNDIQRNGLYLVSITDKGTNSPLMFCEFRLRYADL